MIGPVVENLIGAFLSPRASMRRLLAGGHGMDAALLLVLLAFLVRQIFMVITPGVQIDDRTASLGEYLVGVAGFYLMFGLLVILAFQVGRMFGGVGSFKNAALAIAWYLLVGSLLTPLLAPAWVEMLKVAEVIAENPGQPPPDLPRGALLTAVLVSCVSFWLLASYVAELHRFTHTWNVLFVVLGLTVPMSMLGLVLFPFA